MARKDTVSAAEAVYIWDAFLEATATNKMGRVKNAIGPNAVDRRKLLNYIKSQRLKLHTITFKDSKGDFTLDEDDDEDAEIMNMLYAIEPFINECQNWHGPDHWTYEAEDRFDITAVPDYAFHKYVYEKFDVNNPTEPDPAMRLESWERRHPASPLNGASATTSPPPTTPPPVVTPPKKRKGSMKPSISNYPKLTQNDQYFAWIRKVEATAAAEGTQKVFDPKHVPITPQEKEDFEQDKIHIMAVLHSCGDTSIIRTILQTQSDAQLAVQEMREKYSGNSAGKIRAQQLKNELEQKMPTNHSGQTAECLDEIDSRINERNSIVDPSLQYDSNKRYEMIKDFMSNLPEFDAVEDTIATMNLINEKKGHAPLTSDDKCDLYKHKAVLIDTKIKDKLKRKSSLSSALKSGPTLAVNTQRNGKTKNFIKKLVHRKGANNIQLNMTRISFSDADQSPNSTHSMEQLLDSGATENRGVWTSLNAEDESAIDGAVAKRNNGYPGQLGWENAHGLSGRGLMFLGTSERCGALEDDEDGEPEIKNGIFAGVVTLDNGERMLGIFNDYSNTHMSSDPVHSMEQLLDSGATISNGDPTSGDEPQVKLEDGKVIPLVEVDGRLQLMCDQPTLSDLTYLRKVEITRARDGYGIKDGDSIPELEDPSADASDEETTRPSVDLVPSNNQGPLERARYIAVTTDPTTRYTKVDLDWTIKKSAQGSIAKARVVTSPGKIKINGTNPSNLSQYTANGTEHGEKLIVQSTNLAGMYNYCNREEDDMHYHMKGAIKDTNAHVSM